MRRCIFRPYRRGMGPTFCLTMESVGYRQEPMSLGGALELERHGYGPLQMAFAREHAEALDMAVIERFGDESARRWLPWSGYMAEAVAKAAGLTE